MGKTDGWEYIYVLHCPETGLRKIGLTADLKTRLTQHQAESAYPLDRDGCIVMRCAEGTARLFEEHLHDKFAHKRTHGEWFKLDANDLVYFDQHPVVVMLLERVERADTPFTVRWPLEMFNSGEDETTP